MVRVGAHKVALVFRKLGVGIIEAVEMGDDKFAEDRHHHLVDLSASDDHDLVVDKQDVIEVFQIVNDVSAFRIVAFVLCQHNVLSPFQWALWQTLPRFPSHEHGVSNGSLAKLE